MNPKRCGLRWTYLMYVGVACAANAAAFASAQELPPPPSPPAVSNPPLPASNRAGKTKLIHIDDFLIRGTVFNEKALSFPSVEVRVRVSGEKKYRWATHTNSRGDFAVRVPQGKDYDVMARAKGFADQTRSIDAKKSENEETIVFRMGPVGGDKK